MKKLQRWHSRLGLSSVGQQQADADTLQGTGRQATFQRNRFSYLAKSVDYTSTCMLVGCGGEWVGAPGSPPLPLEQRCQVPHEAAAASTLDEAGAAEGGRRQWLLVSLVSLVSGSYQPDDCRHAPPLPLSLSLSPL